MTVPTLPPIDDVGAWHHTVPTQRPEADGTLEWSETTIVVAECRAGGVTGIGYTYSDRATVDIIRRLFAPLVRQGDPLTPGRTWTAMVGAGRNLGVSSLVAHAISALDTSLWDLKARLLGLPLAAMFGGFHERVPAYGSGGFTSDSMQQVTEQVTDWVSDGFRAVKVKVGRDDDTDISRVKAVRAAVGPDVPLMIDANGAYTTRRQAVERAWAFAAHDVTWLEEPVSSDDLDGLSFVRNQGPPAVAIVAGEYASHPWMASRLLHTRAVDILQLDATRCLGYTGFLLAAAAADTAHIPVSAHTAPQLHAHVCTGVRRLHAVEWFHDHARVERQVFDNVLSPQAGDLVPHRGLPGNGLLERTRTPQARQS